MIVKHIVFFRSLFIYLLIFLGFGNIALAGEITSSWQNNYNSSARLLIGNYNSDKKLIIGLELSIEKGSYSYWRNPGDSGIPPIINFKKSINIEKFDIKYPVPEIITHSFGSSNGYKDNVIFPIILELVDEKKPLNINITFDYGICDRVCVPVRNELSYKINNLILLSEHKSLLIDRALNLVPNYDNTMERKVIIAKMTEDLEDNLYLTVELNASENSSVFIEENEKLYLSKIDPSKILANGNLELYYEIHSNQPIDIIIGQILSLIVIDDNYLIKEDIIIE